MSRRVSLPTADDLFRPTAESAKGAVRAVPDAPVGSSDAATEAEAEDAARRPSGRIRHDEKMTVYVTSDELLDLEDARLSLRRHQGLSVDRGRLVREAVALALADYDAQGEDCALVRRLRDG